MEGAVDLIPPPICLRPGLGEVAETWCRFRSLSVPLSTIPSREAIRDRQGMLDGASRAVVMGAVGPGASALPVKCRATVGVGVIGALACVWQQQTACMTLVNASSRSAVSASAGTSIGVQIELNGVENQPWAYSGQRSCDF